MASSYAFFEIHLNLKNQKRISGKKHLQNVCQMYPDIATTALITHYFNDLFPSLEGEIF